MVGLPECDVGLFFFPLERKKSESYPYTDKLSDFFIIIIIKSRSVVLLQLGSVMMSMSTARVATEGHIDACGLGFHIRTC